MIYYGENTYGIPSSMHYSGRDDVYIGSYCSIADKVEIILGGEHRTDFISTYPFLEKNMAPNNHDVSASKPQKGSVTIENDVWIGHGAKILGGSHIYDGAVIGAYAVVVGDVPPYAIVIGNPSRILRYRFNEEQIEALLKIKWWDWGIDKIQENAHLLTDTNIEGFIRKHVPS
jgi:acetyltransferase-like isoleucine patch superfamily enzyme